MNEILTLIDELLAAQQKKLFDLAKDFVPQLTQDDLLQPNDYPILEQNPYFRYQEGVLMGIHAVRSALLTFMREHHG